MAFSYINHTGIQSLPIYLSEKHRSLHTQKYHVNLKKLKRSSEIFLPVISNIVQCVSNIVNDMTPCPQAPL